MYWAILIYMFFGWSVGVVFQWNALAAMFDVFFFFLSLSFIYKK